MKKLTLSLAAVFVGASLLQTVAKAQADIGDNGNPGDLILGFQTTATSPSTASTTNLEVDLGNFTDFTAVQPGHTLDLSSDFDITDLTSTYGTSPTSLLFGVLGTNQGSGASANEIFISEPTTVAAPNRSSRCSLFSPITSTTSTMVMVTEPLVRVERIRCLPRRPALRWPRITLRTPIFRAVRVAPMAVILPAELRTLFSSNGSEILDLYDIKSGTGTAALLGTLDLTANTTAGTESIIFTAAAVPEPSTYALFGISALVMIIALRRRMALQA